MAARGATAGIKALVLAAAVSAAFWGTVPRRALAQTAAGFGDAGLRGTDDGLNADGSPILASNASSAIVSATPDDSGAVLTQPPASSASPANYGKPKPAADPSASYAGRPKSFAHALPPLDRYPTAASAKVRPGAPTSVADADPPPTVAQLPSIPKKPKPKPLSDPYAPLGINVGALRLDPFVEVDSGYDSNPDRVQSGAKPSAFLHGQTGLTASSDWNGNTLNADLRGGYYDYLSDSNANRPEGSGKIDLDLDATRLTVLDFELRGSLDTQRPGSPGVASTVQGRPLETGYGATAGVTKTFARLSLGLHGVIDRETYQDGRLADGTIVPLSSENYTDYGIQARAAYAVTPGAIPFIETDLDTRKHDQLVDYYGYERDSNGVALKLGTTFELSRILTGTLSGGYVDRLYQDPRLAPLKGPTFDSALVWAATPLTTVTLKAATTIGETTVPGASGELSRAISLGVSHALLRNLTLTGLASYGTNSYQGAGIFERDYLATLGFNYSLTRSVVLTGTFTHERLDSTAPGASFTDTLAMVGIKLQR